MTPSIDVLKSWVKDPVLFVKDNFNVEPDSWQCKALKAFASKDPDKIRIAMRACAGPGKSACMAWMGWNFLSCYGRLGQHPKGVVISITNENLASNIWPEMAKWMNCSDYLKSAFTWTGSRIFANDHPETWFLSARSWPKTANEEEQGRTLSGVHSDYVLFLIDESGDIPLQVLKAAEQALSSCKWGKIVQAGNPTSMTGMLYAACSTQAERWHTITITGDPDDPNRSPRIKIEWAREQIALYGRTDPWVMAYILGLFPLAAINALISPDEVEASMSRIITEEMVSFSDKRIGVDCARFGDDRNVIARRQGLACMPAVTLRNARSEEIAARVAGVDTEWGGADLIFIDATGGYGAGPEDALRLAKYKPLPINFSGQPLNPKYFNKRSEMLCEFAEWIKRGGSLPRSMQLKKELTALTYFFANGKIRVVEKDAVKVLIKCSPDECDAYALTFAMPDRPRNTGLGGLKVRRQQEFTGRDYDPFNLEPDHDTRRVPL